MIDALADCGVSAIDGAAFDLGVSSMQLDEPARGFSFRSDGPLSMRMDGGAPDASDVVNTGSVEDLASIFRIYGEERAAGRIARAIVRAREQAPIRTTAQLAEIVAGATPRNWEERIHPATRAFQALRIFVNDELGQIARALAAAERLLRPAGRLVVVSFHSLEDRIVKRFMADRSGAPSASRHAPALSSPPATFRLLASKAQAPASEEIVANPRARSAKMRAAVRLDAPARSDVDAFAPPRPSMSKPLQDWR
jgi:16S rRNA (cytosine1402-N4)-methyltransferase